MSRPTWSEKGKAFEHLANLLRARRTACHTYRGQAILMSSQVNLRGICNLSAPTRPTVITCVDRLIGIGRTNDATAATTRLYHIMPQPQCCTVLIRSYVRVFACSGARVATHRFMFMQNAKHC